MIAYDLKCKKDHVFEAWFPDSASFEKQRKGGKIPCPFCGDNKVEKALMAPNVATGAAADAHSAETRKAAEALTTLAKLREQVEKHCDFVGDKFAEEARKIHHGEIDNRNIYGQATSEEGDALREEGIEFGEIPWLPRHDG